MLYLYKGINMTMFFTPLGYRSHTTHHSLEPHENYIDAAKMIFIQSSRHNSLNRGKCALTVTSLLCIKFPCRSPSWKSNCIYFLQPTSEGTKPQLTGVCRFNGLGVTLVKFWNYSAIWNKVSANSEPNDNLKMNDTWQLKGGPYFLYIHKTLESFTSVTCDKRS